MSLLQCNASNFLPEQNQEPEKPVITLDRAKELYMKHILNSKYNHYFKPPLFCYFVDWKRKHSS